MDNEVKTSLKKISSTVTEKNHILWENEAYARCYKQKCEDIAKEIERIREEINVVDRQIEVIEPENQMLSTCFDVQIDTMKINHQSLINQRLYTHLENERNKNITKRQDEIITKYEEYCAQNKENQINSSKTYKELLMVKVNFKKSQINAINYQHKINQIEKIHCQKLQMRKRIFQKDIINFATTWLRQQKIGNCLKMLESSKQKEIETLNELLEVQETVKKQKLDSTCVPNKFPSIDNSSHEKKIKLNDASGYNLQDLIQCFQKNETIPYTLPEITQPVFNNEKNKVRILDVKTVKPPSVLLKSQELTIKKEKSVTLSQKMDLVIKNISSKFKRQTSKALGSQPSQMSQINESQHDVKEKLVLNDQTRKEPLKLEDENNKTSQQSLLTSQNLNDINTKSQMQENKSDKIFKQPFRLSQNKNSSIPEQINNNFALPFKQQPSANLPEFKQNKNGQSSSPSQEYIETTKSGFDNPESMSQPHLLEKKADKSIGNINNTVRVLSQSIIQENPNFPNLTQFSQSSMALQPQIKVANDTNDFVKPNRPPVSQFKFLSNMDTLNGGETAADNSTNFNNSRHRIVTNSVNFLKPAENSMFSSNVPGYSQFFSTQGSNDQVTSKTETRDPNSLKEDNAAHNYEGFSPYNLSFYGSLNNSTDLQSCNDFDMNYKSPENFGTSTLTEETHQAPTFGNVEQGNPFTFSQITKGYSIF